MPGTLGVTPGQLLLFFILTLPDSMLLYPIMRILVKAPYGHRDFILTTLLLNLNMFTNRLIASYMTGLNIFSSLLFFLVLIWFVFRVRGWKCLLVMMQVVLLLSLMEAVCMLLFALLSLMGFDQNNLMVTTFSDNFRIKNMLSFSLLNVAAVLLVLLMLIAWNRILARRRGEPEAEQKQQWLYARSILRLSLLVLTSLGMLTLPFVLFSDQPLIEFLIGNKENYIVLTLFSFGMIAVAFSYMLQDIRYIGQLRKLNTLEHQQAISRSLLQNLRFFRHNMVNMLYGLEGVLIGGDREKVTDYYRQMQEKCALVNNENIAALERVTNHSVGALLLHGVDKARTMNLPINLYVQEKVFLDGLMRDSDLCQVLGVLLDNAIEAAHKAEERFVSIEIRDVESAVEIIIKNTYSGQIDPHRLTHGGTSTKEGHSGDGLLSCYQILGKYKSAFLNFWVTGQYVQAQLLLSR